LQCKMLVVQSLRICSEFALAILHWHLQIA